LEAEDQIDDLDERALAVAQRKKEEKEEEIAKNKSIGFVKAWTLPGVPLFVLAYSCTKGTCYGILFWLAPYLKDQGLDDVR
jgi:hypothetical protein